jgi:peptide/nickel transport system substrate-binding protein
MRHRRRAPWARLGVASFAAALAVAGVSGCGGDDQAITAVGPLDKVGNGGTLVWATADRPLELDPLLARTRADRLVTRQIYEPLVEQLTGPFNDLRVRPGLGVPQASNRHSVWNVRLRSGVHFQDGSDLDASAVLANVRRWEATAEGRALLPGLAAVDAPRPDLVRFVLSEPNKSFSADLANPHLGLVSPRTLKGAGLSVPTAVAQRAGTGPFELRELTSDHAVVARNVDWWGTPHNLGPALEQVEFRVIPNAQDRYDGLSAGDVRVADDLGPSQLEQLSVDPLLTSLPSHDDEGLGLERSVRGIRSGRQIPLLNNVWLTTIATG